MRNLLYFFAFILVALIVPAYATQWVVERDQFEVVDGDTLKKDGVRYRIMGIDAPESKQVCGTLRCGYESKYQLAKFIHNKHVRCAYSKKDRYGRPIAVCQANQRDVGRYMVRHGWAFAYTKYSKEYSKDESYAKQKGTGIWAHAFVYPWDWRKNH